MISPGTLLVIGCLAAANLAVGQEKTDEEHIDKLIASFPTAGAVQRETILRALAEGALFLESEELRSTLTAALRSWHEAGLDVGLGGPPSLLRYEYHRALQRLEVVEDLELRQPSAALDLFRAEAWRSMDAGKEHSLAEEAAAFFGGDHPEDRMGEEGLLLLTPLKAVAVMEWAEHRGWIDAQWVREILGLLQAQPVGKLERRTIETDPDHGPYLWEDDVRFRLAKAILRSDAVEEAVYTACLHSLSSPVLTDRILAIQRLAGLASFTARRVVLLHRLLSDAEGAVVREAITALGVIGPEASEAIPTLEKLSEHEDKQIAERAKAALRGIRG